MNPAIYLLHCDADDGSQAIRSADLLEGADYSGGVLALFEDPYAPDYPDTGLDGELDPRPSFPRQPSPPLTMTINLETLPKYRKSRGKAIPKDQDAKVTTSGQKRLTFYTLPPEIRIRIYSLALPHASSRAALPKVSRLVNQESTPIIYGQTVFSFWDETAGIAFFRQIGSSRAMMLRELRILGEGDWNFTLLKAISREAVNLKWLTVYHVWPFCKRWFSPQRRRYLSDIPGIKEYRIADEERFFETESRARAYSVRMNRSYKELARYSNWSLLDGTDTGMDKTKSIVFLPDTCCLWSRWLDTQEWDFYTEQLRAEFSLEDHDE